jgi:hypothetical protein
MATFRPTASMLLSALAALGATAPAGAAGCEGAQHCVDVPRFSARLSDFRAIEQSGKRMLIATVKFENKTDQPLILGYVTGSGLGIDELGNRYTISDSGSVRGIGLVSQGSLDTRFTLQPGERADARFELDWRAYNQLAGAEFRLEMALREIEALPGNQYRAGREHLVSFAGLRDGLLAAAPAAGAPPAAAQAATAAPAPAVDPCGDKPACFSAGTFTAEVTGLTTSQQSSDWYVQLRVRFQNHSGAPVILAYQNGSGTLVDGNGLRYKVGSARDVSGIGIVTRDSADPQFVIGPGETRTASLTYAYHRYAGSPTPDSTVFSPDFVVEQLEVLPSRQIRSVREYLVSFTGLAAKGSPATAVGTGGDAGDALKKLGDLFRKKK